MRRAPEIVVAVFLAAGLVWFVVAADTNGSFATEDAYIGLGYLAATLGVGLLAFAVIRYFLTGGMSEASSVERSKERPPGAAHDRDIVTTQLRLGAGLIALGAVLAVVFGLAFDDTNGIAIAMGTAVIGAGAALLPAGAAASASARILSTLPQQQMPAAPAAPTPPGDDSAGDSTVVDEVETYGGQSPVTGLAEADVESSLSGPALADHELETEPGAGSGDDVVAPAEPT